MNYPEFQTSFINSLNARTSEGVSVQIQLIKKNNDVDRIGLVLCDRNGTEQVVSPIVYPEMFYAAFQEGASMETLSGSAWELLNTPAPDDISCEFLTDREYIKGHVVLRLIGFERNREALKTMVHRKYLDMAVTIGISIGSDTSVNALTTLTLELFEKLGLQEDEIFRCAALNSVRIFGDRLRDINILLHEPELDSEIDLNRTESLSRESVYVLTNRQSYYGAGTMLYSGKIRELSRSLGCDLLIIPSSIHELILLGDDGSDTEDLRAFVAGTNRSELRQEDVLTDSVYRYSRERDRIEIACA